jgi:hypothetical protein
VPRWGYLNIHLQLPRTPGGVRFFCDTNQGLRSLCSLNPWLISFHAIRKGAPMWAVAEKKIQQPFNVSALNSQRGHR